MQTQILFISDFHLGTPTYEESREREQKICHLISTYLDSITELFLVGDVFDFWFEYKTVVPQGYYRFFGLLAALSDRGIPIHYFTGNHDMWVFDMFQKEFNAKIYRQPMLFERNGVQFFVGHGDGLGPKDYKYKFLKKFFASKICQFLFQWIHPDIGVGLANYFSYRSRYHIKTKEETYFGNAKEWLYIYVKDKMKELKTCQYFIFGHRHLPIYTKMEKSDVRYINLGDWLVFNTYALFDGKEVHLLQYDSTKKNMDFCPN